MADDKLQALSEQLPDGKNLSQPPLHPSQPPLPPSPPPLHLWHPELSGDIDILIKRDGSWIHEGRPILRPELVKLFASIMRHEEDGEYYLLTPVEKWRLQVECLPLLVIDFEIGTGAGGEQQLTVTLNTERQYRVNCEHPLYLPELEQAQGIPAVELDYGLSALFGRAAWYRLAELCEESDKGTGVWSSGQFWVIAD
ncbi:MAG: DUF1285 domain-containing protein [Lysobacterales bacterium]